jgi:hypothetical protein
VQIYGSLDRETGGIVDANVIAAAGTDLSLLTGYVDSVSPDVGRAVVSGVTVDYNALMYTGVAPSVGDRVSVVGRMYRGVGTLVAE